MTVEIRVTDLVNGGVSHRNFNREFIERAKSSGFKVSFASKEFEYDLYSETNEFNKRKISKKYKIFIRYILFFYYSVFKNNFIIVLAADNTFTPLILMLISIFTKNRNILIIFHNNYAGIRRRKWKYYAWSILYKIGFQFAVLSKSVKDSYLEINIKTKVINHPIIQSNSSIDKHDISENLLLLGRWNNYNYNEIVDFLDFLRWCREAYPSAKLLIRQNSVLYSSLALLDEFTHFIAPYPTVVSQFSYLSLIRSCKAVILPGSYHSRGSVSGLLFDALSQHTPVICPKEGLFLEVLGQDYPYYAFENISVKDTIVRYPFEQVTRKWNEETEAQLLELLTVAERQN